MLMSPSSAACNARRYVFHLPTISRRCDAGSVVQEGLDDTGDREADVWVDGSESMYESSSVDRSEQLALDVADFVEAGFVGRLHFDVKREPALSCRQWRHDDERECRPERIGRA